MGSAFIDVTPYHGTLQTVDLLSGSQTLVSFDFGASESGEIVDPDGTLGRSEGAMATFNDRPITLIGSGTVRPGVESLGMIMPEGPAKDVVVFRSAGRTLFYYPEGAPSVPGMVAVVLRLTEDPWEAARPNCFSEGTFISTPGGEVAVEDLARGDLVEDIDGRTHPIRWISRRAFSLRNYYGRARSQVSPVLIPRNAFGPGLPHSELRLPQHHLVYLRDPSVELYFAEEAVLVPAKSLVGDCIRLEPEADQMVFYQFLCDEHLIVRANGLPTETLRLGSVGTGLMSDAQRAELSSIFPDRDGSEFAMRAAAPVLTLFEGRVLSRAMAPRLGQEGGRAGVHPPGAEFSVALP